MTKKERAKEKAKKTVVAALRRVVEAGWEACNLLPGQAYSPARGEERDRRAKEMDAALDDLAEKILNKEEE